MKLKWLLIIVGVVVIALGLGVGITKMTLTPFFVDRNIGIGGLHTKIFDFQPYYLYSYQKNEGVFAKVFYIRGKWIPKVGTLWLTGKYGNESLEAVELVENNKVKTKLASKEDVDKYFGFGQRMSVWYLTGETLGISAEKVDVKICGTNFRICQVNDLVLDQINIFTNFSRSGSMPWGQPLPVLVLSLDLRT